MITIVISNGHILVNDEDRYSLDFEAYCIKNEIGIRHINQENLTLFKGRVKPNQITLNGVIYGNALDFVYAFNAVTAPALSYLLTNLKANTDYCNNIVGEIVTNTIASTAYKVKDVAKPGYLYIRSDPNNAQNVFIGNSSVVVDGGELLEPGDRTAYEIDDLSKIYFISVASDQNIFIGGAYKD